MGTTRKSMDRLWNWKGKKRKHPRVCRDREEREVDGTFRLLTKSSGTRKKNWPDVNFVDEFVLISIQIISGNPNFDPSSPAIGAQEKRGSEENRKRTVEVIIGKRSGGRVHSVFDLSPAATKGDQEQNKKRVRLEKQPRAPKNVTGGRTRSSHFPTTAFQKNK